MTENQAPPSQNTGWEQEPYLLIPPTLVQLAKFLSAVITLDLCPYTASTEDLTTSNKTPNRPTSSGTSIPSPPPVESDLVDLTYFRKLHSDVTARLTEHCRDWEEKSGSLEEQEDVSEDGGLVVYYHTNSI